MKNDALEESVLDKLFDDTDSYVDDNPTDIIDESPLLIDLDEVNTQAEREANTITERLSAYYFDQKYIDEHPYIPIKIKQEMNNIRRLLKMLTINERAQDTIIRNITSNGAKAALYSSLTSLQSATLNIQSQLNTLVQNVEIIFSEMQAECDKTFTEKEKDINDDGSRVVRGSRDFIKQLTEEYILNKKEDNIQNEEFG